MTPADTLALSADRLSALLRDTIRERVQAAQNGEQMRADVIGEDVQAICDVIAYEADVIAGVKFSLVNGVLVEWVNHCTCAVGPHGYYGAHERGCGSEPVAFFTALDRLICPGCDMCAGAVAA